MKDSVTIGVKKKRWVVCFENTILDLDLSIYEKMVYIVLCSHAKKDGTCFPCVKTIASEASCSRTKVFEALRVLESRGIITRDHQIYEGRGQTSNNYEIIDVLPRSQDGRGSTQETLPPSATRTGGVRDADAHIEVFEQDQINKIKESPLTPQGEGAEESHKSEDQNPDALDICAVVVEIYNSELPTLPTAEKLTEQRRRAIRVRIRDDPARKDPEWWRSFFGQVRQYPWLMGENPDSKGWKADLDWLLKPGNLQKVLEGRYPRRLGTTGRTEAAEAVQKQYMREGGTVDARALLRNTP